MTPDQSHRSLSELEASDIAAVNAGARESSIPFVSTKD